MSQSFEDVKIGLRIFRDNILAYFAVMAFIVASIFLITAFLLITFVFGLLLSFLDTQLPNDVGILILIFVPLITFFVLIIAIFFSAFNGTLYGLSYDIMSSGDLYTEFKHAFTYFRKFWLKYLIISLFALVIAMSYYLLLLPGDQTLLLILIILVDYLSLMYITGLYTSVTAKGSLKNAIFESEKLLIKDFRRIALTIGIYYIIFRFPYILFFSLLKQDIGAFLIGNMMIFGIVSFLGTPILTIFATRIYNTNNIS